MGHGIKTFYTGGCHNGDSTVLNVGYVYGRHTTNANPLPPLLGMILTPWRDYGQHQRGQVMLSFTSSRTKAIKCLPLRIATYLRSPGPSLRIIREPLLLKALEGRQLNLGDTYPHTLESWNNLIALHESWNKPTSGEQNCHKKKLRTSDITDVESPLSGTEKHPDFQGQVDRGNFTFSLSENRT
jgi:hypothetical protein